MAQFKNMEEVANFLVNDYRFKNLCDSSGTEYDDESLKDGAYEVAETWKDIAEKNSARWGIHGDDEALRRALSDWMAEQLLYHEDEFSYVTRKRAEYTAAQMVYQAYKVV